MLVADIEITMMTTNLPSSIRRIKVIMSKDMGVVRDYYAEFYSMSGDIVQTVEIEKHPSDSNFLFLVQKVIGKVLEDG